MSKPGFSKKEMNQLRALMNQTHLTAPVAKKKPLPARKKSRRNRVPRNLSNPETRVAYTENVGPIKIAAGQSEGVISYSFYPGSERGNERGNNVQNFPILARFGKIFESYRIHAVTLEWSSSAGANTNGLVVLSFDSNPTSAISKFNDAAQCRPAIKFPIWTPTRSLRVPTPMLMPSLLRYNTNTQPNVPFSILAGVQIPEATRAEQKFGMLSLKWDISFVGISPTT